MSALRSSVTRQLFLLCLAIPLLFAVAPAEARQKFIAFVDDDWDPVDRSYVDDPGYEFYIIQGLQDAGLDFDVFEVQTSPSAPAQVPPLSYLRQYPLVLWNCAAETVNTLSADERSVLVQYLDLGGRVFLTGQGILDDLIAQTGDPDVAFFLQDILGVLPPINLNQFVPEVLPLEVGVPYIAPLEPELLNYSGFPDSDPSFADRFTTNLNSFLFGFNGGLLPLSSERYRPRPIHFQSFMIEAIADPVARGDYFRYLMEWQGLEGDWLEDLMNDPGRFELTEFCADNPVEWSPLENAFVFTARGVESCESRWRFLVAPEDGGCEWRIGFSHQVDFVGVASEMVLLELMGGAGDRVELSLVEDPAFPGQYALHYIIECAGTEQVNVYLGDLSAGQIRRTHLRGTGTPANLDLRIMDVNGNIIHQVASSPCAVDFDSLRVRTKGLAIPFATPLSGWVDDYFFEGCLQLDNTAADAGPGPMLRLTAHPNPFNPSTLIRFDQPTAGLLHLAIHDVTGKRVRVLLDERRDAGSHAIRWDGRDDGGHALSSGVYLMRLNNGRLRQGGKLVLLK